VVTGHWLIAAPWAEDGTLRLDHMLSLSPWTQWLTWLFQVMPVFFMVGGFSNAASWEAARKKGTSYGPWLNARLKRLVGPVVLLLAFWAILAAVAHRAGVHPEMIRIGSQTALVPVWFLAVYVMVVAFVPLTRAAWRRFGIGSFWALAAGAVAVDLVGMGGGFFPIRWVNYGFVWLAVHQLGYLWRDERAHGPARALPWAAGGLLVLVGLVKVAGYPLSMVGVPGDEVSNTLPPTLAMLALGCLQGGLLLSLQRPARRGLARTGPWAATILVNGTIMTVYLWHLTAMILVIGLANLLGQIGLGLVPGTAAWWLSRPLWMTVFLLVLFPFLAVFGRFEQQSAESPARFSTWRGLIGAALVCFSLALLALDGIGAEGWLGIRAWVLLAGLAGAWIAGALPGVSR
jgi:hypothetical protein